MINSLRVALLVLSLGSSVFSQTATFDSLTLAEGTPVTADPSAPELFILGAIMIVPGTPRFAFNGNSSGQGSGGEDSANSGRSISFPDERISTIQLLFSQPVGGLSFEALDYEIASSGPESLDVRVYDQAVGGTLLHMVSLSGADSGTGDGSRFVVDLSTGFVGSNAIRRVELQAAVVGGGITSGVAFDNISYSLSSSGVAYCFGDGTGSPCPCGASGGAGEGCMNTTTTTGATLTGSGEASLANDTFQLDVAGVPGNKPGLILLGANQLNGGLGSPVGDGLLCVGGMSQRSQVQVTAAGLTTFTDFQGQPFGQSSFGVGVPTNYQWWYRDTGNTCSGAGFNFSNAWTTTWLP